MQSCVHSFFSFFLCPTDRPTFTRGRAMGNETFYGDGHRKFLKKVLGLLAHVTPSNFFFRILKSEALV